MLATTEDQQASHKQEVAVEAGKEPLGEFTSLTLSEQLRLQEYPRKRNIHPHPPTPSSI